MKNNILTLFDLLNSNNIKYFVLRDYNSIDDIVNSKDIDLYVSKSDRSKLRKIFRNQKWVKSNFNNKKYPHEQFLKLTNTKVAMFDVVYGCNYGAENYKLDLNNITNNIYGRKLGNICIANEVVALVTMTLHILFDKGELSNKNQKILKDMYNDYNKNGSNLNPVIEKIVAELAVNPIDSVNKNISKYKKEILKTKVIKYDFLRDMFVSLYISVKKLFVKIKRHLSNKTIAIIGMDGSGKSSTIDTMKNIYGDKAIVVYMGNRDFKSKKLEKIIYNKNNSLFNKIFKRPLLFFEMLNRYIKYRYSGKVVLFDRYADDIVVFSNTSFVDKLFFKHLFPKPKIKIYLYCSVEEAYKRKNDIEDKELYNSLKYKYDEYYKHDTYTYKINTEKLNEEETISEVCEIINKYSNFIF